MSSLCDTTIEADPRHVQILLKELRLQEAKTVATPGVKCDTSDSEALNATEMSRYRSLVMRGCCLALDPPDIAHSCKELARNMSAPKQSDWNDLKRLCRYLKGVPRLVWRYNDQLEQYRFTMFTDSDDAGCAKTRKSTSAGAVMHGSHLIIFYSGPQHVFSLSSRESEFYAGIKAGSTLLGAISMALDLGELRKGVLTFDTTAAAMLSRKGHGRAKHTGRICGPNSVRMATCSRHGRQTLGRTIETLCAELTLFAVDWQHKLGLVV